MKSTKTPTRTNPEWWQADYDSAWDRAKAALKRDWEQTKHDFGGDEPDTDQDADDTVAQAVGKQPIPPSGQRTFEQDEDAYRFGYGARQHYKDTYQKWNDSVEDRLREDWESANPDDDAGWEGRRDSVRYGWDYKR